MTHICQYPGCELGVGTVGGQPVAHCDEHRHCEPHGGRVLTAEERAEARRLADAATPAPWDAEHYPDMTPAQVKAWIADCIDKGGNGLSLVQSRLPPVDNDSEHPTVAETGNGPTSVANAAFIAASRTLVPKLLDALEAAERDWDNMCGQSLRHREERDAARAQVKTLVEALRYYATLDCLGHATNLGEEARNALKAAGLDP